MMNFILCVVAFCLVCCFGIEGSMRKLDAWGKASREKARQVSCDLKPEACEYLRNVKLPSERKLKRRRRAPETTPEQFEQLNERGQNL